MTEDNLEGGMPRHPQSKPIESARRRADVLRGAADIEQGGEMEQDEVVGSIQEGSKIGGRYRLERRVGQGGMGVVWLARDLALSEPVALKFLPGEVAQDPVAVRELREEARVMLGLTHPNIVRLHDIRFFQGGAFLVQAYMGGGSLEELLRRRPQGALSVEEVMWAMREVVQGIAHAHANGITHRDIKPANLLLSRPCEGLLGGGGESLRVADFGLAFTARQALSRSSGYRPSGTLAFMAPEILLGKRPTPAADVYSLAATVFCMIEGRPPFSSGDLATQILQVPAPRMHSGRESLDRAVESALAKDAQARPASPEEFLRLAEGSLRMASPVVVAAHDTCLPVVTETRASSGRSAVSRGKRRRKTARRADPPIAAGVVVVLLAVAFFTRDEWLGGLQGYEAEARGSSSEVVADSASTEPKNVSVADEVSREEQAARDRDVERRRSASIAADREKRLSGHLRQIDRASSFRALEASLGEAHSAGFGGECEQLCAAAIGSMRSILGSRGSAGSSSLAEALEQVEELETLAAFSRSGACAKTAEWVQLTREAVELPKVESALDFESDSEASFAVVSLWSGEVSAHQAAQHACLLAAELDAVRDSIRSVLKTQLSVSLAASGPGFLEVLAFVEQAGEDFPDSLLPEVRKRIDGASKAGSLEQEEAWIRALSRYLEAGSYLKVGEQAQQVRDQLLGSLAIRAVEESAPDVPTLFSSLAEVENLITLVGSARVANLEQIPTLVRDLYRGKKRQVQLVSASYEYASQGGERYLLEPVAAIMASAEGELLERLKSDLKKASGSKPKKLRESVQMVDAFFSTEARFPELELELGVEGELRSVYQRLRPLVDDKLDEILEGARKKRDKHKRKLADLNIAASRFLVVVEMLEDRQAFAQDFARLLPELTGILHQSALGQTQKWMQTPNNHSFFSTEEFDVAIRWSRTRYQEAMKATGSGFLDPDESLRFLIDVRLDFAKRYLTLCERQVRSRKGTAAPAFAPKEVLNDGETQLQLAETLLAELDPGKNAKAEYARRINNMQAEFLALHEPVEKR